MCVVVVKSCVVTKTKEIFEKFCIKFYVFSLFPTLSFESPVYVGTAPGDPILVIWRCSHALRGEIRLIGCCVCWREDPMEEAARAVWTLQLANIDRPKCNV